MAPIKSFYCPLKVRTPEGKLSSARVAQPAGFESGVENLVKKDAQETIVTESWRPNLAVRIKQEEDDAEPDFAEPPSGSTSPASLDVYAEDHCDSSTGGQAHSERIRQKATRPRKPTKVYVCTGLTCKQQKFSRSQHLARHLRTVIHQDCRPFKCPQCARLYSRSDNLKQHIADIHGSDPDAMQNHLNEARTRQAELNEDFAKTLRPMATSATPIGQEWLTSSLCDLSKLAATTTNTPSHKRRTSKRTFATAPYTLPFTANERKATRLPSFATLIASCDPAPALPSVWENTNTAETRTSRFFPRSFGGRALGFAGPNFGHPVRDSSSSATLPPSFRNLISAAEEARVRLRASGSLGGDARGLCMWDPSARYGRRVQGQSSSGPDGY